MAKGSDRVYIDGEYVGEIDRDGTYESEPGKVTWTGWTRSGRSTHGWADNDDAARAAIAAAYEDGYDEATGIGGLASFYGKNF